MEGTPIPPPLPGPDPLRARSDVKAPAILMMVIAALGLLGGLLSLVTGHLFDPATLRTVVEANPEAPEWVRQMAERSAEQGGPSALGNLLSVLPLLLLSALGFVGGLRMMALRTYGLAVAGAVALCIPCVGSCCCLGIPVGAWALYVLTRPHVKAAFRP
jgi:hypothetical protein